MATRFPNGSVSLTDAIDQVEDKANFAMGFSDNPVTTTSFTATVGQFLNSLLRLSGQAAITITTPTAAAIVAAIPNAQVGSAAELDVVNNNTGTATLAAGTGVTLVGVTAVPTVKTQAFRVIVTNATLGAQAVSVIGRFVSGA